MNLAWRISSSQSPWIASQQAGFRTSIPTGTPRLSPETFSKAVLELIYLSCPCKFRFIK